MTLHPTTPHFRDNAHRALKDAQLQKALANTRTGFIDRRASAVANLPEFDALRDSARDIKDHVLAHLDLYLEEYESKVTQSGGHVHFARDAREACAVIVDICRNAGARTVTKGKSMVSEEIGLNAALEAAGIAPVETDLGEYIIQLRHETPSHIIAPAIHLNKEQVEQDFRRVHRALAPDRDLAAPPADLAHFGVKDGDQMKLKIEGPCGLTFDKVRVREHPKVRLEVHIDTDEGNACQLETATRMELIK